MLKSTLLVTSCFSKLTVLRSQRHCGNAGDGFGGVHLIPLELNYRHLVIDVIVIVIIVPNDRGIFPKRQ